MKGGSKLFIFAGVGLALVAVLLFATSMGNGGKANDEKGQSATTVDVATAKTNIKAHRILTIEDIVITQVEAKDAPADASSTVLEVAGQASRVDLVAGEPILRAQLEVPGLRNDIEPGKRAIALPVNDKSAMSGLVQAGDYIDIVFKARIDLVEPESAGSNDVTLNVNVTAEAGDGEVPTPEPTVDVIGESGDVAVDKGPVIGDPGTEFFIRDDIGDVSELELVAKIMLQDVRILRVVRPGETYLANGTVAKPVADAAPAEGNGQFILEVTPEQAELISFIQDGHHEYQIVVRNKDDHQTVTTSGITYSILATDEEWALPWPKKIVAPVASPEATIEPEDASKPDEESAKSDEESSSDG